MAFHQIFLFPRTILFSRVHATLSFTMSVGWLVGWSVGLLICRSVGLSVCRSVDLSVCKSVDLSICRSVCRTWSFEVVSTELCFSKHAHKYFFPAYCKPGRFTAKRCNFDVVCLTVEKDPLFCEAITIKNKSAQTRRKGGYFSPVTSRLDNHMSDRLRL